MGTPSMFAEVFVLLFLCFWRAFRPYTLLTVSNVAFLFEHLFTYCMIDSDLKRASFISFHSSLRQFDSSFFFQVGKFFMHCVLTLQDFCNYVCARLPAVLSFPIFLFHL